MVKLTGGNSVNMMDSSERIRKALFERLQALQQAGVTYLPRDAFPQQFEQPPPMPPSPASNTQRESLMREESLSRSQPPAARPLTAKSATPGPRRPEPTNSGKELFARPLTIGQPFDAAVLEPYGPPREQGTRSAELQVLQTEVQACTKCPELARTRRHTVFGVGNPQAKLCLLGEAPGADEDLRGEPFVGPAGQLLDKILSACKLRREDVFILNTLKCRPPLNRTPSDQEVANCWHFAHRQLELIQPQFICCLGSVAAKSLLRTNKSISALRGVFHSYRGSRVVVTYHPAYLLRTPSAKRHVWDDMKMLMAEMGISL